MVEGKVFGKKYSMYKDYSKNNKVNRGVQIGY